MRNKARKALLILVLLPFLAGCTMTLPGEPYAPPLPVPDPVEPTNQRPIPLFEISSREPYTEEAVIFDATLARDEDGWIVAYLWNFAAYGIQTAPIVAVTYHEAGKHPLSLTVTDNEGATATRRHLLTVRAVDPCNDGSRCGCH